MANNQNLIPQAHKLSVEEQSRGGLKSGESRRRRKTLKEELLMLLNEPSVQEAVSVALIKKAQTGDVRAFVALRDTIGEAPQINIGVTGSAGLEELKSLSDEELRRMADKVSSEE